MPKPPYTALKVGLHYLRVKVDWFFSMLLPMTSFLALPFLLMARISNNNLILLELLKHRNQSEIIEEKYVNDIFQLNIKSSLFILHIAACLHLNRENMRTQF